MKKHPLKSKTILSTFVIILMAFMSILGVGEKDLIETYDQIEEKTGKDFGINTELITLIAAGGAIYGRYKVKEDE